MYESWNKYEKKIIAEHAVIALLKEGYGSFIKKRKDAKGKVFYTVYKSTRKKVKEEK
jgi:hypothetical protein